MMGRPLPLTSTVTAMPGGAGLFALGEKVASLRGEHSGTGFLQRSVVRQRIPGRGKLGPEPSDVKLGGAGQL